jgi:hypothetical protein
MTTILHDGPPDSVGWLVARLREIAEHASTHDGAPRPVSSRTNNDPAGKVLARMSHVGRTTWLTVIAHLSWDGRRMVRLVYRRSSSAAVVVDAPLPRRPLSELAGMLPDLVRDAADVLRTARIVDVPVGGGTMRDAVAPMPTVAMALHGGDVATWMRSSTPWSAPTMIVRDPQGRRLPIRLTDAGRARISDLGHLVRFTVAGDGAYSLEPETWSSDLVAYDVVEAMRACSKEGMALCTSDMDRNRTDQ